MAGMVTRAQVDRAYRKILSIESMLEKLKYRNFDIASKLAGKGPMPSVAVTGRLLAHRDKKLGALNKKHRTAIAEWRSLQKRYDQKQQQNPSMAIPRNKWISGKVKVDSRGKIQFKAGRR